MFSRKGEKLAWGRPTWSDTPSFRRSSISSNCARVSLSSKSYPSDASVDISVEPSEVFGENSTDLNEAAGDTGGDIPMDSIGSSLVINR